MTESRIVTKLTDSKSIENLSARLAKSANQVVNFLEAKQQDDGSFGADAKDIACYFKSPMMFIAANKMKSAIAVLKYIKITFMTREGDFRTNDNLKSVNEAYVEYWSYTNGWIARAANQLGIREISKSANCYLNRYNLGEKVGFSTNEINKDPKITDVLTVAHHGLLHLENGNSEVAISAGNYLCQAIAKQPDIKKGFYLRLDKEGKLITNFSKEKTPFYFVSTAEPNQLHFMIGYPAAYLAMLYNQTKKPEFLIASKVYLDFSLSCHASVYVCDFSHKIAWAASLIYECTWDEKYLDVIAKITDYFLEKQEDSGMWFSSDITKSYDQSAEIACWFLDILKHINAPKGKVNLEEGKELKNDKSATKMAITNAVDAIAAGAGAIQSKATDDSATFDPRPSSRLI